MIGDMPKVLSLELELGISQTQLAHVISGQILSKLQRTCHSTHALNDMVRNWWEGGRSYSVLWSSWNVLEGHTMSPSCLGGAACPDSFTCCKSENFGEWHLCTADEVF